MKTSKLITLSSIAIILLSCNASKKVTASKSNTKTYAEISIKEGGYWKGREYMEGKFKNVADLKVPSEHTDHSWYIRYEGPGWESNKIAYRLYLDWRNAIDIFGKVTETMVLSQVGQDGFDSYHEPQPWGSDILKVGKAKGFDYVLDASQGQGVIFAGGTDLLVDVKTELGF